jgi:osmotically-inducible protein OsmY
MTTRPGVGSPIRALLVLALGVSVGAGAAQAAPSDQTLAARVEGRLAKAGLDQEVRIVVEARDGSVTLSGVVLTLDARRRAEKAALDETKQVENRIRVVPEPRPEAEIRKQIVSTVLGYPHLSVFDSVEYAFEDGVLVLQGSVRHGYRRSALEERLGRVPGVREIRNDLEVQSASLFDDRLRSQLVRSIYGDDRFIQYAHFPHPPIRIVVDRGRVTLTGVVRSPVERVLAEQIARGTLAFTVENRLRVEGERAKEKATAPGANPVIMARGERTR